MFDDLLPSVDVTSVVGPIVVVVVAVIVVWVVVVGGVQSYLAGDGHFGIIEGYVGFVRHGKSMLCAQDCIALARGRNAVLASNIAITAEGVQTELVPIGKDGLDLDFLMALALRCRAEGRGLVLMIDEAGIVMPSRQWQSFPVDLMWLLQQSGKLQVEIRWTSQHPAFVDAQLRSLTAVVHRVQCFPPPSIKRRLRGKRPLWFQVTTSIPGDFDKADPDRVMWKRRIRYRRAWEASYDTDAAVLPSGRLKGASDFAERLTAAGGVRGLEGVQGLDVDPRLRAHIDSLPQKDRQLVLGRMRQVAGLGDRLSVSESDRLTQQALAREEEVHSPGA